MIEKLKPQVIHGVRTKEVHTPSGDNCITIQYIEEQFDEEKPLTEAELKINEIIDIVNTLTQHDIPAPKEKANDGVIKIEGTRFGETDEDILRMFKFVGQIIKKDEEKKWIESARKNGILIPTFCDDYHEAWLIANVGDRIELKTTIEIRKKETDGLDFGEEIGYLPNGTTPFEASKKRTAKEVLLEVSRSYEPNGSEFFDGVIDFYGAILKAFDREGIE